MTHQIPLKDAVLCANCDCITARQPNGHCAHCQSEAVLGLARMLDRETWSTFSAAMDPVWRQLFEGDRAALSVAERLR